MAQARRFVGRRTPSLKTWSGQGIPAFGTDLTGTSGNNSAGLISVGTPATEDITILRTRGAVVAGLKGTGANETYLFALGLGLVTTEAAAVLAVPLPLDNPDWDGWFVYQTKGFEIYSDDQLAQRVIMEIDSKAMRKIPSGQTLFLATQVFSGDGTSSLSIKQIIQLRGLLKTS